MLILPTQRKRIPTLYYTPWTTRTTNMAMWLPGELVQLEQRKCTIVSTNSRQKHYKGKYVKRQIITATGANARSTLNQETSRRGLRRRRRAFRSGFCRVKQPYQTLAHCTKRLPAGETERKLVIPPPRGPRWAMFRRQSLVKTALSSQFSQGPSLT